MDGFLVKYTNSELEQDVVIGQRCAEYEEPLQPDLPDLPDPPPGVPPPPGDNLPPTQQPCPLSTRTIYYEDHMRRCYRTEEYVLPPGISGVGLAGCSADFASVQVPCSEARL